MKIFLRKILQIILLFTLLVAVLEIILHFLKIPKISHHSIRAKGQVHMPRINNNTILIIGDSKLEWGLKANIILGSVSDSTLNVVNMAMPGSNGLDVLRYVVEKKINPKFIITGYAPNYGAYNNHGFDKMNYTYVNKIIEQTEYYMDEHFYFRDRSILEYLSHGPPFFKDHLYDSSGGAAVYENGDYRRRVEVQTEMYLSFKRSYRESKLNSYCDEADSLIGILRQRGTLVCGIQMPMTRAMGALIDINGASERINSIHYNKAYNFLNFTYEAEQPNTDSAFFYDGCHLEHRYAEVFTKKFLDSMRRDFSAIR